VQSGSAEVRIEFALLSSQFKTAREWETITYFNILVVEMHGEELSHLSRMVANIAQLAVDCMHVGDKRGRADYER
jgi:hypothetical protein